MPGWIPIDLAKSRMSSFVNSSGLRIGSLASSAGGMSVSAANRSASSSYFAMSGSTSIYFLSRLLEGVGAAAIVTIEGVSKADGALDSVQQAFHDAGVPQCGFCQAGQIMQASALLQQNPHPSHDEIRDTMSGNICRCGCYQRIETAVLIAATGA